METRSKEVVGTLGLKAAPSFAIARMHPVLGLLTINAEDNPHFVGESLPLHAARAAAPDAGAPMPGTAGPRC